MVEDVAYYNCLELFFIDVWKLDLWDTGVYCACIHGYIKGKILYVLSIETFLELYHCYLLIPVSLYNHTLEGISLHTVFAICAFLTVLKIKNKTIFFFSLFSAESLPFFKRCHFHLTSKYFVASR